MDLGITDLVLHFAAAYTGVSIALRDREAGERRRALRDVSELSGIPRKELNQYRALDIGSALQEWAIKPAGGRCDADIQRLRWKLPDTLHPVFDQYVHSDDLPDAPTELGAQLDFYAQPENAERLRDTLLENVRQFLHSAPVRKYLRA